MGNQEQIHGVSTLEQRGRRELGGLQSAFLAAALGATSLAHAQLASDDALTWKGITLYGTIDIGLQFESHGASFSDYYTPASTNIIQKNGHETVFGVTNSNVSQSKVGLKGQESIAGDWSGVFGVETWFNPQSGDLSDSLKSLTADNGLALGQQTTDNDGSSAGQSLQIAYVGLRSDTFGTLTFGRQSNLISDGVNLLDPNLGAPAYSLLGASGAYAGAGSTEDKRLDSTAKYLLTYADTINLGLLYKFNNSNGASGGTAFQANIGAQFADLTVDAYYSKINDAISASALIAAQVTGLAKLGYASDNSVAATISDNTTLSIMASYKVDPIPLKVYAGYEHIQYANPTHPVLAGTSGLGGYTLAYVNNTAYADDKKLNVYWAGARYSVLPKVDVIAAFYRYRQSAYGTGAQAGCSSVAFATCSGSFRAYSLDARYHLSRRFALYGGFMWSAVSDGLANGYPYNTTNINPTIGARFNF